MQHRPSRVLGSLRRPGSSRRGFPFRFQSSSPKEATMTPFEIDTGTTAWLLASAALVLLMTPGLAFFYGGMVRAKSVLNMMMMSFGAMASVGVVWVLWGYSEAFGNSWNGLVGNPFQHFGLSNLLSTDS